MNPGDRLVALSMVVLMSVGSLGACGGEGSTTLPNPVPQPTRVPMRVEPIFRNTFGAGRVTPAGTTFYLTIVTKGDNTVFGLFLCGEPCTTAVHQISWFPENYEAGDELSGFAPQEGEYYLWGQDIATRAVDKPVSDTIRGDKLRITFESGAVIDAWYVLP